MEDVAIPTITARDLEARLTDAGTFVLDLRGASSGTQIPSARQYDPKQLAAAQPLVLPIAHDGVTVLIDESGDGRRLREAAAALTAAKYLDVRMLEGGFKAWVDAGLPVVELSLKQPVAGAAEHQLFR